MFVVRVYSNNEAYQHDDVVVYISSFTASQVYLYSKFYTQMVNKCNIEHVLQYLTRICTDFIRLRKFFKRNTQS